MPMDGNDLVEPTTQCPLRHGVRFHTSFGGRSNREEMKFQLRRFIREKQAEIATLTNLERNYESAAKKNSEQAMYRRMTLRRSNIVAEALVLWAEDCLEELEKQG